PIHSDCCRWFGHHHSYHSRDTRSHQVLKLTDLFDVDRLKEEIQNGYVRKTLHPTLPLAILNYTEKAAFDRRWNSVTRRCRGLIYQTSTEEVIASGPAKFFNYGESSAIQY